MGTKAQHQKRYAPIPPLLRRMRESAGLSQRVFARKIGRTQNFVQTSETGSRRVDFSEFVEWTQACGIVPGVALAEYLASATKSLSGELEVNEGTPPTYGTPPPSPARLRKAKDFLRRALEELGEGKDG